LGGDWKKMKKTNKSLKEKTRGPRYLSAVRCPLEWADEEGSRGDRPVGGRVIKGIKDEGSIIVIRYAQPKLVLKRKKEKVLPREKKFSTESIKKPRPSSLSNTEERRDNVVVGVRGAGNHRDAARSGSTVGVLSR